DNSTPFVAALYWLATKYHIHYIQILAYNFKMNGIIEHLYHIIHDSLVKACEDNLTQWPTLASHIFWADHIIT
ncbi:hypothetical protein F5I97DRAFT_1807581, partial [Phlebopus sp. FC_14]